MLLRKAFSRLDSLRAHTKAVHQNEKVNRSPAAAESRYQKRTRRRSRSASVGSQNDLKFNMFKLPSPATPNSEETVMDFWTGAPQPTRSASRISSMNSSLHGYKVFDPQEQSMKPATIARANSGQSVDSSQSGVSFNHVSPPIRWLPPPPRDLETETDRPRADQPMKYDICGKIVKIQQKRHWKPVRNYKELTNCCLLTFFQAACSARS